MKHFLSTFFFLLLSFCVFSQIEIEATFFENNSGYDSDNNVRSENLGAALGLYTFYGTGEPLNASLNVKARTTGFVEFGGMAHFNLLWFFEPWSDVFVGDRRNLSLLFGSGLTFSNAFFNTVEIPIDMRFNFKWDKFRLQTGLVTHAFEASHFKKNTEFFISVYYEILSRKTLKNIF